MEKYIATLRASRQEAQQQTFRFLALPAELRLLDYSHLITKSGHKLSYGSSDGAAISLIVRDPIPPIHLTRKFIHGEALPLLKKLSNSEPTSRIILALDLGSMPMSYSDAALAGRHIIHQLGPVTKLIRLVSTMCWTSDQATAACLARTYRYGFGQETEDQRQQNMAVLTKFFLDAWWNVNPDGIPPRDGEPWKANKIEVALDAGLSGEALGFYLCGFVLQVYPRQIAEAVKVFDAPRPPRTSEVGKGVKRMYGGIIDEETWQAYWK